MHDLYYIPDLYNTFGTSCIPVDIHMHRSLDSYCIPGAIGMAFAPSFHVLVVARFIAGIGVGISSSEVPNPMNFYCTVIELLAHFWLSWLLGDQTYPINKVNISQLPQQPGCHSYPITTSNQST